MASLFGAPRVTPDPVFLVNAGVPISDTKPYTTVVQIPPNIIADGSGQLSIRNVHPTATMYFKWVQLGESSNFAIGDAGIVLPAGVGWDTRLPPPGKALVGQSTVNGAICSLEVEARLRV